MNCPVCNCTNVEVVNIKENNEEIPVGNGLICHDCKKYFRECEVYSRVVGYLRPVSGWNDGKKDEFKIRKTFNI
jgi:anaerobic ribonucleoside-triphosphate reductase